MCWEPGGARQSRAEALGWVAKPRDGMGDQIGYLRLRVARAAKGVNGSPVKIGAEAVTIQLLLRRPVAERAPA
jgi:hypothetical protein